jgi:hypothetical protein
MKKIFAIMALAATAFAAQAADFVSVDVDHVQGRKGGHDSTAQYVRAGKGFGDYQVNLQSRSARRDDGLVLNSLEVTTANKNVSAFGITPFVGVGHDNGFDRGQSYNYGLVGATYGRPVGPGFLLVGAKTRVGSTEDAARTKQTVGFATYSVPVAKNVAVNLNASRSGQDIKEKAFGVGLSFGF